MPKNGNAKKSKTNIEFVKKGTDLVITIDLSKNCGESKSGKSLLIATAGAGIVIDDMKLNLNLYKAID
jgi:hypothetical protein